MRWGWTVLLLLAATGASTARELGGEIRIHRNLNDVRALRVEGGQLIGESSGGIVWSLETDLLATALREGWRVLETPRILPAPAAGPVAPRNTDSLDGYRVTARKRHRVTLFTATLGGGLYRDGEPIEGSPRHIRALEEAGDLLVLGHDQGLGLARGARLREIRFEGPPDNHISALAWDGKALWVGYFDAGLARLEGGGWSTVAPPEDREEAPQARWINTLCFDGKAMWVGSNDGLYRWSPESVALVRVDELPGPIHSVRIDSGTLVVAGADSVWLAREGGWEEVELPGEALHTALLHRDTLWTGGMWGVREQRGAGWRRYTELNGRLPHSWVTALLVRGDTVWAGTYDAGLVVLREDGPARAIRPSAWVNFNALAPVGAGVAVGTMGDGLLFFDEDRKTWRRLSTADGLPSDDVTAVLETPGVLWVATRAGLAELRSAGARTATDPASTAGSAATVTRIPSSSISKLFR